MKNINEIIAIIKKVKIKINSFSFFQLLLYDNEEMFIGWIIIEPAFDYIRDLYIKEEYRGFGFSKILLNKSIELCKNKKLKNINLKVERNNDIAIKLYKKFGFTLKSKKADSDNMYYMQKILE